MELRAKRSAGELLSERTFAQAAERFQKEYEVMTEGERNEVHVKSHYARLRNHLTPYFGKMGLSQVNAGAVQDYRIFRRSEDPNYKPPSKSTMHKEIVTLRQVLKTAVRHGWLAGLPDLSEPYKKVSKVSHRAWFSPDEYKTLYTATRANIKKAGNSYHQHLAEQLHDKVLFMANTGIRPDEANWLEYRDVEIVEDDATGETILEIEVRGKRGVGYCKSTTGAVRPFERMLARNDPSPTDRLFPVDHKKQFNRILEDNGLKIDREGEHRCVALPFKAQSAGQMENTLRSLLKGYRGNFEHKPQGERELIAKGVIAELRIAWEQGIAEFIKPVLNRFDRSVKPNSLFKLLVLSEEDVSKVAAARTRLSEDVHAAPETDRQIPPDRPPAILLGRLETRP